MSTVNTAHDFDETSAYLAKNKSGEKTQMLQAMMSRRIDQNNQNKHRWTGVITINQGGVLNRTQQ